MALDWQCSWCGEDLPDHRLHLSTCSPACDTAFALDESKRLRATGVAVGRGWRKGRAPKSDSGLCRACKKPKESPKYRWCASCMREAREAHRRS